VTVVDGAELSVGSQIAQYRVQGVLGRGAMGVVYEATHNVIRRRVALKVISPGLADHEDVRGSFRRERGHIATLDHPNIVALYDAGEADGMLYLAMALIEGGALDQRIAQADLTPNQVLKVLSGIASALDAAHAAGLVHRDVKPSNILLSRSGHPYLSDFGITAATDAPTSADRFMGTPAYAAPEQIHGDDLTGACDIYGLTAVLYGCLTGEPPFPRATRSEVELAHLTDPPPRLVGTDEVHRALDGVIQRGLAKSPADRFATATALVDAIRSALSHMPADVLDGAIEHPGRRGASSARRPSSAETSERHPVAPSLAVMTPEGEEFGRFDLGAAAPAVLRVGRERHNDIVLAPDPDRLIGRKHCTIERVGQRWHVRDLDSRLHVFLERSGQRAPVAHCELIHGDVVCLGADKNSSDDTRARHWRLAYSDPATTQVGRAAHWLAYYPTSEVVWVLGGWDLPRRVRARPKARRMLLSMLARHHELDTPPDGVFVTNSELKAVLWPEDADPQARPDSAVANVAWELRAALGDDQQFLHTVRNSGYRLTPRP
jgi:serine/threonine protein kinase/DNA-binding response OmpR family regulator